MSDVNNRGAEINRIRFGQEATLPERRVLRAGEIKVCLEGGELRYLKAGDFEIVSGIYAAVRDRNWGTIAPEYFDFKIEERELSLEVSFEAVHRSGEIDFSWFGRITGMEDSTIRYEMHGKANKTFYKNRTGFCLLHPAALAGMSVEVESAGGTIQSSFPNWISPHQPFFEIKGLRYETPAHQQVENSFEGDLFEMEDQRNWTDASFKTYCTPLSIPYPTEITADTEVRQAVTIKLSGPPSIKVNATATAESVKSGAEINETVLLIGQEAAGYLPQLGIAWDMAGLANPDMEQKDSLHELKPDYLRIVLRLQKSDWQDLFLQGVALAERIDCDLEIELIAQANSDKLGAWARLLQEKEIRISRVFLFPEDGCDSIKELLVVLTEQRDKYALRFMIGGGTRVYFAEFNRMELPLKQMEAAGYTINPQMHAFDLASITETLTAQFTTVKSAKNIIGEMPLSVGPITFKPRLNPYAKSEDDRKKAEDPYLQKDARQFSLFGAGWTLGSISQLAAAGVELASYFQAFGPLGIVDDKGSRHPVYTVLQWVLAFSSKGKTEWLPIAGYDPISWAVLAMRSGNSLRIIISNLTNDPQKISVNIPGAAAFKILELNEHTTRLPELTIQEIDISDKGLIEWQLQPFASICLNGLWMN